MKFSNPALKALISGYTRESGVRSLDRALGQVMRNIAMKVAMEEAYEAEEEKAHAFTRLRWA